jgi:hypothetical protein
LKPNPAGETATPPPVAASPPAQTTQPAQTTPPAQTSSHPGSSTVQIVTDPAAVRIVMDDDLAASCTSPCILHLPPGRHTLRAEATGYQTARRIISLPGQSDLFLTLDKAIGTLTVSSTPPGATIFLDNKELSQKTPAVLSLPEGIYHVEIERDGRRVARDVPVATGEMHSLDLTLR